MPLVVDVLIALTLGLGAAPVVALARTGAPRDPSPSVPYRETVAAPTDARRARGAGAVVIASGVLLVLLGPLALLVGFLSTISFATGRSDATAFVLDTLASIACVTLGPALVVAGRRLRRGEPTTRLVAAAAAVHAHALVAAGLFVTLGEPGTWLPVGGAALVVAAAGQGIAALVMRSGREADDAATRALGRRRAALASLFVGTLLVVAAVLSLMIADEMGDRMTTRPDVEVYVRLRPHALVAAGSLAVAALVDLVVGVRALVAARTRG